MSPAMPSLSLRRFSTPSISQIPTPSYKTGEQALADVELTTWTPSLTDLTGLLRHHPGTFNPTLHLQIETPGKPWLSLPLPLKPDPIHVFTVNTNDGALHPLPRYTCIRPERNSGSCSLIYNAGAYQERRVSTTTYRFGPGKPPVVSILSPGDAEGSLEGDAEIETFPITSPSLLSHSQTFHTTAGTFTWRYTSRSERKTLDPDAGSIMILERVSQIATVGGGSEEVHHIVGRFVRSNQLRTPGSKASSAGNGGRLMLDLDSWDGDDRHRVEVLAVTTLLVMLKKEVDRRRAAQIALMMSGGGGGGP